MKNHLLFKVSLLCRQNYNKNQCLQTVGRFNHICTERNVTMLAS